MKKYLIWILIFVSFIFTNSSCSNNNSSDSLDDYEYIYNPTFEDEYDDFITLDGRLDEEEWENQNRLYYSEKGIDFEYTTIFTTKGVFIGAVAYDKEITYYGRYDMKNNSGFAIRVTRPDVTILQYSDVMLLEVDAYDRRSFFQDRFAAGTHVEGVIDSLNTHYMSTEMFVSWNELGYEKVKTEEDIPTEVKIHPSYRYVQLLDEETRLRNSLFPTFSEPTFLRTYYPFTKDGYAIEKVEGCALGNAKNGNSRTLGWDLTKYNEGKVTSTMQDSQAIYFSDVIGKNFVAQATITLNNALGTSNSPRFGLIAHGNNFSDFRALYLKAYNSNKYYWENNTLRLNALTYNPNKYWHETDGIYQELNSDLIEGTNNSITVKVVKCDTTLLFFVEDKVVYSESKEWYSGDFCPGLYALDCSATFSNFYARELSDEDIDKYFSLYSVSRLSIPTSFRGGSVSSTTAAVNNGEEFELTVKPNIGYYLSSLTINGKDYYGDYCSNSNFGAFTVKDYPIKEKIEVDATFERFEKTNNNIVYGSVLNSSDGKSGVPSASIKVISSYKWLYFIDKTSSSGAYIFDYLPAKGTNFGVINGEECIADGYYDVTIETEGYRSLSIKYYVDQNGYHYDGPNSEVIKDKTDILMTPRVVGGIVSSSNFVYSANTEKGWDLSNEHNNVVIANRGSSNVPLQFTGVVSKQAVIDLTVQDAAPDIDGYDIQPSLGVSFRTGKWSLGLMVDGTKVRILPDFQWYNDSNHLKTATNNDGTNVFSTTSNQKIDLRIIRDNDLVAMLAKTGNAEDYTLVYSGSFADLLGMDCAYGLYSRSSGLVNNIFSNYSISTDKTYVQEQINNYLIRTYELEEPENAKVTIVDDNGQQVNPSGSIAGTNLNISVTANSGYYVEGILVNGERTILEYKNEEHRLASSKATLLKNSVIEVIVKPLSEKLAGDIDCTISGTTGSNSVTKIIEESSDINRGLYYLTDENLDKDSLSRAMYIQTKLNTSDLSQFKYLDFDLFEGGSSEKMIPFIVLEDGMTYKLGGTTKNYWSATRISNGRETEFSSNGDFIGIKINNGQAKSTYRFNLTNGASFDQTISTALGNPATSGSYSFKNILSLGIQTWADKGYDWSFGILGIYGVDENGERSLLFDGKQADIKEGKEGFSGLNVLEDSNDVYMWFSKPGSGSSEKVNYQSLLVAGTGTFKINYAGSSNSWDMYSWMKVTMDNIDESLINLVDYDGFSFHLDTTDETIKDKEYLSAEFEFRYSSSNSGSRPSKIYLIDKNDNISMVESKDVCKLPTNFKGTVIVLFENLTNVSIFKGNETIVRSEFRCIVDTTNLDGCKFGLSNLKFIENASELIKEVKGD